MAMVLVKTAGKVKKYELNTFKGNPNRIDCSDNVFNYNEPLDSKNYNDGVLLNDLITEYLKKISPASKIKFLNEFYELFKNAKSEDDLNIIFNLFLKFYYHSNNIDNIRTQKVVERSIVVFKNYFENNCPLIMEILTRKTTYSLLREKIICLTANEILMLSDAIVLKEDKIIKMYLSKIGINFDGQEHNRFYNLTVSCLDMLIERNTETAKHLCFDCKNSNPMECKKFEYRQYPIKKYDFITDGYQEVAKRSGKFLVYKFVVSGCTNFEKDVKAKKRH